MGQWPWGLKRRLLLLLRAICRNLAISFGCGFKSRVKQYIFILYNIITRFACWYQVKYTVLWNLIFICISILIHFLFCHVFTLYDYTSPVNHTSWVAVVTPTDRPKSVRNCCLIELFCGVVYVVTLSLWHFCWYRGFCHRTGSDLLLLSSMHMYIRTHVSDARAIVILCKKILPSFADVKVVQQQSMLYVHDMLTWVCDLFKWNYEQHLYSHTFIPIVNRFASLSAHLNTFLHYKTYRMWKKFKTRLLLRCIHYFKSERK